MAELFLLIGNKNYSSWSLRPWLALKHVGRPFKESLVVLDQKDSKAQILKHSPSGKVPFLRHGNIEVWESLAIGEYLAEAFPDAGLWPKDAAARAHARAVSSEMHAGFAELRHNLPMDISRDLKAKSRAAMVPGEIARVQQIWADCRKRFGAGGPYLFGKFSLADCMFAPVVTRFRTYGVKLEPVNEAYAETIMAHPAMLEWIDGARREPWVVVYDVFKEK